MSSDDDAAGDLEPLESVDRLSRELFATGADWTWSDRCQNHTHRWVRSQPELDCRS